MFLYWSHFNEPRRKISYLPVTGPMHRSLLRILTIIATVLNLLSLTATNAPQAELGKIQARYNGKPSH